MPLIMDATPDTMRYPRRVFDTYYRARQLDKVKIIISLREPVSRDLSWFNHLKADSLEDKLGGNMEEFVLKASNRTYDDYVKDVTIPALLGQKHDDNIENGLYVKYLHTWFEKFPRSHILLLSYEEVLHNSSKARERVERFLDQRFPLSENSANWQHVNAKDSPEKVLEPSCRVQDKLARTFDLYNEQLYALLDSKAERRPPSEQHPFPRFELGKCTGESWKIIHRHPSDTPDQVSSFSSNVAKRKNSTSLPTILIAGAQKSATSAISFWLRQPNKQNNGVCKAHVFDYEPEWHSNQVHFFNRDDRFYNGLEFYEKRFKHCYDDKDVTKTESGMPLILDATPDTLRHPRRVFEMYEKAGRLNKVKIIFSLREPISRDISWFNHKKANKVHNQTYADYVRDVTIPALLGQKPDGGIENGLYAKYLKTWFELFPRRNILILSYHEILHNSSKIRERVETFLGQSFPLNENSTNWQWQTKKDYIGKVVKPMCKTRAVLDRLFEPHNDHLYALLESSSNDRPIMEEYPFPRFEEVECVPQSY